MLEAKVQMTLQIAFTSSINNSDKTNSDPEYLVKICFCFCFALVLIFYRGEREPVPIFYAGHHHFPGRLIMV